MKIIITGATGMVGEGVLLACLQSEKVTQVLIVTRKPYDLSHAKLRTLIVPDFTQLTPFSAQLTGYDACFFCAGISSIGLSEAEFTKITYDTTLSFAQALQPLNPNMVFTYVSGSGTDSSEQGKVMWARVKGKTENDLMKLPFKGVYNFRPGFMKSSAGQRNVKWMFKVLDWFVPKLFPSSSLTLQEVGTAMINVTEHSDAKHILEIADIKRLAAQG